MPLRIASVRIESNRVWNSGFQGISVRATGDVDIVRNTVLCSDQSALVLETDGNASGVIGGDTLRERNRFIAGSSCQSGSYSGVAITDASGLDIKWNRATGFALHGFSVLYGDSTDTIANNRADGNTSTGIALFVSDHAVQNNTADDNQIGIALSGSSSSATGNTASDNSLAGILAFPELGILLGPSNPSDDVLGTPTIGGSGSSKNTVENNGSVGILLFETIASNDSTIDDDNTLDNASAVEAALSWGGLFEVFDDGTGNPISGATVTVTDSNDDTMWTGTTDSNGVAGPTGWSINNPLTWGLTHEWFVVTESGSLVRYDGESPQSVEISNVTGGPYTTSWSWDGNGGNDPTNEFGNANCVSTSPLCRYQIGEYAVP